MKYEAAFLLISAVLVVQSTAYGETTSERCGIPKAGPGTKWEEKALCIVKEHCPKCNDLTIKDITPPATQYSFVAENFNIEGFNVLLKKKVEFDGIDCPDSIHVVLEPQNPGLIKYFAPAKPGFIFRVDGLQVRDGTIKYNKNGQRLKIKVRNELAKFLAKTKFEVTESMENGPKEADVTHVKIIENMKRCGLTIPAGSILRYMGTTVNELIVNPSKPMTVNGITIRPTHHFVIMQGEVCDPYAVDEEEAKKEGWGT